MSKSLLSVFDLDDTLFRSPGNVYVRCRQTDGWIRNVDYSMGDTLAEGEYYDYSDFRNAKLFYDYAQPIDKMVKKYKKIVADRTKDSMVCIITARADLDDAEMFRSALKKHGVYYDDVHIYRAGNYEDCAPTTPLRKTHIIATILHDERNDFNTVEMFDDSYSNLRAFNDMKKDWSWITFKAFHVNHKGNIKKFP